MGKVMKRKIVMRLVVALMGVGPAIGFFFGISAGQATSAVQALSWMIAFAVLFGASIAGALIIIYDLVVPTEIAPTT